jgi:hypothetical protein
MKRSASAIATGLPLVVLLSSISADFAWARDLGGVSMPDQKTVGGKSLVLNGMGIREATMFKVDVYVAGLYLEAKSQDAAAILASPETKQVDLNFVRDVGAKDIREAWSKSLKNNCATDCAAVTPKFEKLNAAMEDMKNGDVMSFSFLKDKTEITVKGKAPLTIEGADFARVMLASWLGPNPPNEGLKRGMLGGSQ